MVARLVAALALGVRLGRFHAQPFQGDRGAHQLGLRTEQGQQQFALAHGRAAGDRSGKRVDVRPLLRRHVGRQHAAFVLGADAHGIAATQAFQFARGALAVVLQRLQLRGIACLRVGILPAGRFDHVDQLVEYRHACRQRPVDLLVELGGGAVPVRRARVTGQHRVVAGLRSVLRQRQVRGRAIGHVVRAVGGRLAVPAHVGAQQGEIAGVARPHEIVDLVAVVADRARRCVNQPDVAQFQLFDAVEVGAVVHVRHTAADAGLLLAVGDDRLAGAVDSVEVGPSGLAGRILQHGVGDLVVAHRDQHAEIRIGGQLGGKIAGNEAVVDQVPIRLAVVLDDAIRHVMVGEHQPVRRDEGAGAAAGAHDGAQRCGGDLGQCLRVALETSVAQRLGQLRQLRGHPHAFVGVDGQGEGKTQCEGGSSQLAAHRLDSEH